MKKRPVIQFMTGYYYPEKAAGIQLCQELFEKLGMNGFQVNLITPIPTRGVTDEIRKQYKKKKIEASDNLYIKRYWLPKESNNFISRAFRYFAQNLFQLFYGLSHHYDVLFLYSTPPTNGLVGSVLKKLKRKPFIYNLHDVFPDSLINMNVTGENSVISKVGRWMERVTYKNADRIITVSNGIKNNIEKKGTDPSKITTVYNWVDEKKSYFISRDENSLIKEFGIDTSKFVATYAGNIGVAQCVVTILGAAELLKDREDISFIVIGSGAEEKKCKEYAKEHGLSNVRFLPMQSPDRIPEVYSLGDVSFVTCKKGFGDCGMPSKSSNIMASKSAILASFDVDSELGDIIRSNNLGIIVPPEDPVSIADAVRKLAKEKHKCAEYGNNGYEYYKENLTKEICTEKISTIIDSLLSEQG